MPNNNKIRQSLFILIGVSTLIRGFIAATLEFGNDEVYYYLYALYPDLSHFDHPPMVGLVIQLFTLNLKFDSEFFIRLASVVFGAVNTFLAYRIGSKIKDEQTGFYAALLYTSSIYTFVIAGIFILPDTPQMLFWLLTVCIAIEIITKKDISKADEKKMLLAGVTIGFGVLSKYTSVFLWAGIAGYIILYNREWLKKPALYFSVLISIIMFIPVIYWNIENDFISLGYQGGRVNLLDSGFRPDYFLMEIMGEFFYNNPVNFIIIYIALWVFIVNKRYYLSKENFRIIALTGLPLIATFIFLSFFRRTLPHWTGPGYTTLIFIAAPFIRETVKSKNILFPGIIKYSIILLFVVLITGYSQINYGLIWNQSPKKVKNSQIGNKDVSLDIYGWKQINEGFTKLYKKDIKTGKIGADAVIISYRWFPLANIDYYIARPNHIKVLAIGSLYNIHKYATINRNRGGFHIGMDAYYITTSHDFVHADTVYREYFNRIESADTIQVYRGGELVMNAFVFRMLDMKKLPNDVWSKK
jgi:hypothetical protein